MADGAVDLSVTGAAPFMFSWSNGATTEDLVDLSPGNFSVTVIDANGCETMAMFTIGEAGCFFDLALTKEINTTATPVPFVPGDAVQFTITVFNQGTLDAYDVDVMDDAPVGLSLPTLIAQAGVCLLYTSPSPRDRG